MTEETIQFNSTFDKYKNISDKYESLYIFVVRGLTVDDFLDKINKIVGIIDDIPNSSKRGFLKTRLHIFIKYLEGLKSGTVINGIYLLGNDVNEFEFRKYWKDTLLQFGCDNLLLRYGDNYQLEWLKSLLLDRTYINIMHLKNNVLKHFHLNSTKRRLHQEKNEKKMDIQLYINENIPKGDICIIHGVSSFLKTIKDSSTIRIFNGDKKDDQLFEEHEKIINEKNGSELQEWLDKLLDPKDGKKIVFGIDIKSSINDKLLKTLYCSPDVKLKIIEKVPSEYIVFDIVVVKSFGDDIGRRLVSDFKGAVGIRFY